MDARERALQAAQGYKWAAELFDRAHEVGAILYADEFEALAKDWNDPASSGSIAQHHWRMRCRNLLLAKIDLEQKIERLTEENLYWSDEFMKLVDGIHAYHEELAATHAIKDDDEALQARLDAYEKLMGLIANPEDEEEAVIEAYRKLGTGEISAR